MLNLNSSHSACRREVQLEVTGPQRWLRRACIPSYSGGRLGWPIPRRVPGYGQPGARRVQAREQAALVVPVLAVVGFAAEARRLRNSPAITRPGTLFCR
jgi:hypothetical protein